MEPTSTLPGGVGNLLCVCVFLCRLKSAQLELKELESCAKQEGSSYAKDRAALDTLQREIDKMEVGGGRETVCSGCVGSGCCV